MADYECWKCRKCGNETIIPVVKDTEIILYSCMDEDCQWYAQTLVMMDDGIFISQSKLLNTVTKMWKEHEQDKIQESKD